MADLFDLVLKIVADHAKGGTIVEALEQCAEPMGTRLLERAGGGITQAITHLQDLLRPLLAALGPISASLTDPVDPATVGTVVLGLLSKLAGTASSLSIDTLRGHVGAVLDVLQDDLGLTPAAIEDELWAFYDDLVARIDAIPPETDVDVRTNRLGVVAILRRIKRRLKAAVSFPDLSADRLAAALFDELRGGGLAAALDRVACVGAAAGTGLAVVKDLVELLPVASFGPHSLGAAEAGGTGVTQGTTDPPAPRRYLWYASWLLGDKDRKLWQQLVSSWLLVGVWKPRKDVWVADTSPAQIWFGDQLLAQLDADQPEDVPWSRIPSLIDVTSGHVPVDPATQQPVSEHPPLHYSFTPRSLERLESIARHSAWMSDASEALLHVFSTSGLTITKGGMLSVTDLLDMLLALGHGTFKLGKKMPYGFWIDRQQMHWFWKAVLGKGPAAVANVPGTFQGFHTSAGGSEAFLFWLLLALSDWINALGDALLPGALRDALLSMLTVANYEPPAAGGDATRPDNRGEVDGIVGLANFASTYFYVKAVFSKNDYGFLGGGAQVAKLIFVYDLFGAFMFGAVGGFLGTLAAWAIGGIFAGGSVVDGKVLGVTVLKTAINSASPLSFLPALYAFKENDTSGGTWNLAGPDFAGYPANGASPYLLPWSKGRSIMCFQGNQGFFSHNATNPVPQVYAYDLMLDKGDQILAARPGTVVDYFDWVPDGSHSSTNTTPTGSPVPVSGQTQADTWNFVAIRHDREGPPNATHDVAAGGTPARTVAIYGHGLQGSVRTQFLARGVAPANIIGSVVAQGQPVMRADNTGSSFCNHVHMEVRPEPQTSLASAVAVADTSITVTSAAGFPGPGNNYNIQVESETMTVTAGQGTTTWTVTRAVGGSSAAAHPAARAVTYGVPLGRGFLTPQGTMPFVFKDVSNQVGPDGVPKSRRFYESQNPPVVP